MMTRGYVVITKGTVERVAYLESDAYLSYYGLEILKRAFTLEFPDWVKKLREKNIKDHGKKNDPCRGFELYWIRPDERVKKRHKEWHYAEYGYLFDFNKQTLKVYHYGKLLFAIREWEVEKYTFIFANEDVLYDAISYDSEKLKNMFDFTKTMRIAAKEDTQTLKAMVDKIKENPPVYLDDEERHCIAAGHRSGYECYSKRLRKEGKQPLQFIVAHERYGWRVLLQTPYIRVTAIKHATNKYDTFSSEKTAVQAIRQLYHEKGSQLFRLAEVFNDYEDYYKKGIVSFSNYLNYLDKMYEKEPWYTFNGNCSVETIRHNGYYALDALVKKFKEEQEKNKNEKC